jgi:putative transposase
MLYWLRAGCAWRLLPHDLPPWQTVYHYVRCWRLEGRWEQILRVLRVKERLRRAGGQPQRRHLGQPKRQDHRKAGPPGYDGAKKVGGRKRHVLVDTLGLLLAVQETAADVSDRDGAMALLGRLDRRRLPRLRAGWVVIHLAMIQLLVRRLARS